MKIGINNEYHKFNALNGNNNELNKNLKIKNDTPKENIDIDKTLKNKLNQIKLQKFIMLMIKQKVKYR